MKLRVGFDHTFPRAFPLLAVFVEQRSCEWRSIEKEFCPNIIPSDIFWSLFASDDNFCIGDKSAVSQICRADNVSGAFRSIE